MTSKRCYCTSLREATRRLTAVYDDALAPTGVNVAQFSLLRTLGRSDPLALTEFGRLTELDRSTIGRNVKVLERMGLVALRAGDDRRESVAVLSKAGRRILASGAPLWENAQNTVETKLGAVAAAHLRQALQLL
jgi:DNA-binding MarR family transcriptional regulator